jgi:hypothetical protein
VVKTGGEPRSACSYKKIVGSARSERLIGFIAQRKRDYRGDWAPSVLYLSDNPSGGSSKEHNGVLRLARFILRAGTVFYELERQFSFLERCYESRNIIPESLGMFAGEVLVTFWELACCFERWNLVLRAGLLREVPGTVYGVRCLKKLALNVLIFTNYIFCQWRSFFLILADTVHLRN